MAGSLLVAACEEEEQSTPLEALLKAATLQADDFPSGVTLDEEFFVTTAEAAEVDPIDPEDALKKFNEWGHLLTYQRFYLEEVEPEAGVVPTSMTGFSVGVQIYRDADGAQASMAMSRERTRDPQLAARMWPSFLQPSISPLSLADIGDESFAIQVTGTSRYELAEVETLAVMIREDRLLGSVQRVVLASEVDIPDRSRIEELETLADKLHERMEAALKEQPQAGEG